MELRTSGHKFIWGFYPYVTVLSTHLVSEGIDTRRSPKAALPPAPIQTAIGARPFSPAYNFTTACLQTSIVSSPQRLPHNARRRQAGQLGVSVCVCAGARPALAASAAASAAAPAAPAAPAANAARARSAARQAATTKRLRQLLQGAAPGQEQEAAAKAQAAELSSTAVEPRRVGLQGGMTPEDIQGDYACAIGVTDFRVNRKAEYKVLVQISFYSSRTHSPARTSWHTWRSFSAFRKLDEQLRKRHAAQLKGIKFPPLYRRKALFRANLSVDFMENRMRELDNYIQMVVVNPALVAFNLLSVQSQTLKTFVAFANGFGANAEYDQQDAQLRPSSSILASPAVVAQTLNPRATQSVMGDDDDDFRSVSSSSTLSSVSTAASSGGDYRWSGTGFVGSQSFVRHTVPPPFGAAGSGGDSRSSMASSRGSWFPVSSSSSNSIGPRASIVSDSGSAARQSMSMSMMRPSTGALQAATPSDVITPELDMQRAQMEERLVATGLQGVGMPPDGSCLLHCIVYEMYPLQCLRDYPPGMTVVNVGAADGMAPRRVAAAQFLRVKLMEYGLEHVEKLAAFLMQDVEELRDRYETFRDTPDEQATTAELYAVASMFNIELLLISNDESFQIDPVLPVQGLPSVREGPMRIVTLGYMIPGGGLSGHYICTRERRGAMGMPANSFSGGSYRGSISIKPPSKANARCVTVSRPFERIPEQRVE